MIQGLKHFCCEDRPRGLGLFSLDKRKLQGGLIVAVQYLEGSCKKDGARLFGTAFPVGQRVMVLT